MKTGMFKVNKKSILLLLGLQFGSCIIYGQENANLSLSNKFDKLMFGARSERILPIKGHSHNDYDQSIPFFGAYYAGMESIEVDLILRKDTLFAAHEKHEIVSGKTLEDLYVKPLLKLYKANGNRPFADSNKTLQLMIDLKEDYRILLPKLIALLDRYPELRKGSHPIKFVITGSMPAPEDFKNFPEWILFDGRPNQHYSPEEWQRIAMISDNMRNYTGWNGKGVPTSDEMAKIKEVADWARLHGKSFRLWAVPESANAWIVLEKLGVNWLNTDHPTKLQEYLESRASSKYQHEQTHRVYQPRYSYDDSKVPKNIILLIGDGMGFAQLQAAQVANKGQLNMMQIRDIGLSSTHSLSPGNTDSAAGGSAISTGQKTLNGYVAIDSLANPIASLAEVMAVRGKMTGLISTGDASDATPAAFYAHHHDRDASEIIMRQLLDNKAIHYLIAQRPGYLQNKEKASDFINRAANREVNLYQSLGDLQDSKHTNRTLVLLADTLTKAMKDGRKNLLEESFEVLLTKCGQADKGFFIMAEAAQIDYAGHARDMEYAVTETLDFDRLVGRALQFADQDGETLVIVTADHETGALTLLDVDYKIGLVQGVFVSNDHSAAQVPVMAYGPGASNFRGFLENTAIYENILKVISVK